jgi:hypothetical protein
LLFLGIGCHGRQYCMNPVVWRKSVTAMMHKMQQDTRSLCMPGLFLPPTAEISIHEHWFLQHVYTCMIQLEYIATGNQLGEICRNGNEKAI